MTRIVRTLLALLVAVPAMVIAISTVTTVEAAPLLFDCPADSPCVRKCTQQLPNGNTAYYDHGTTITIVDANGNVHKFKCNDGKWESAAAAPGSKLLGPKLLGNIGVAGIAGINGELRELVCPEFDSGECIPSESFLRVGPPGKAAE